MRVVIKGLLLGALAWPAEFFPRTLCSCGSYFPVFSVSCSQVERSGGPCCRVCEGGRKEEGGRSVWLIFLCLLFSLRFNFVCLFVKNHVGF